MKETYFISDAAKQVEVESHVLRYWEEELEMKVKRNEMGHRYYTKEDVEVFKRIKGQKEKGLQLKAIRMVLKGSNLTDSDTDEESTKELKLELAAPTKTELSVENKTERLQQLLQQMIKEAVLSGQQELTDSLRETLLKEMEYQFRQQEEREEARDAKMLETEEAHFRRLNKLLREKKVEKDKRKKHSFF
ncbi:MAG: MerR family transcriptional regulator [Lachnospiraceae bacterium]|nr:MerR family transcriptional regulator [Lachnospiraceae bacterium]